MKKLSLRHQVHFLATQFFTQFFSDSFLNEESGETQSSKTSLNYGCSYLTSISNATN